MSRKDYRAIADIVRSLAPQANGPLSDAEHEAVIERFANGLAAQYRNFNIAKFVEACEP